MSENLTQQKFGFTTRIHKAVLQNNGILKIVVFNLRRVDILTVDTTNVNIAAHLWFVFGFILLFDCQSGWKEEKLCENEKESTLSKN